MGDAVEDEHALALAAVRGALAYRALFPEAFEEGRP